MKKFKRILMLGTMTLAIGATALTSFAAGPRRSLDDKKARLTAQVEAGSMTQEKADEIIAAIEENRANCDQTGSAKIGQKMGARFGSNGQGQGTGSANRGQGTGTGRTAGGKGSGQGVCNGTGLRDGSCSAR